MFLSGEGKARSLPLPTRALILPSYELALLRTGAVVMPPVSLLQLQFEVWELVNS